ncbi:MAG: HlyD family efflux transporter periplasmic adaptor subunit [SAR324 cluster bacterium]|nr:HlyD family efflux transporter periplasmic adaptor subunit [SAR324 cluster bacterium]
MTSNKPADSQNFPVEQDASEESFSNQEPGMPANEKTGGWFFRLREQRRTRLELQFLPAAMEIEETPPAPLGRLTMWLIILLCVITVVWSYLGQVDEVATAPGKFIPAGRIQVVQPFEQGMIHAIMVREGQPVRKGQVLIELDSANVTVDVDGMLKRKRLLLMDVTRLNAERSDKPFQLPDEDWSREVTPDDVQTQIRLMKTRGRDLGVEGLLKEKNLLLLEIARLEAEKAGIPLTLPREEWTQTLSSMDLRTQTRLMEARQAEHDARLLTARLMIQQKQSALASAMAAYERQKRSVEFTRQEMVSITPLVQMEAVPRERLDKLERQLALETEEFHSQAGAMKQAQEALSEAEEALRAIPLERERTILTELAETHRQLVGKENQLKNVLNDRERSIMTELAESERQLALVENELLKVQQRQNFIKLTSPIDGVVLKLGSYTEGGVVQPADPMVYIVPESSELVVEAWLLNRDVGFVKKGMEVALKVETFSFQKYGTLPAVVDQISADSTEHPQYGQVYQLILRRPPDWSGEGDPWTFRIKGEVRNVSIGMNVSAEIKTGKRRVIMFFLSPLIKTLDESVSIR